MRFGRPRPGRSSWVDTPVPLRPAVLRGSGSTSKTPAGVLGISCLMFPCHAEVESAGENASCDGIERPRLLDEGVLSSRFLRVDLSALVGPDFPSPSLIGTFWSLLALVPFRRCGAASHVRPVDSKGEGSRSLIGLTSSGRGRSGDAGDWGMLRRRALFHGVADPDVSIEGRCGRKPRNSDNDAG